uniref:Uncharacterized protein n=1 Tax=Mustela putorius furo TaxID=9669 RepID=M3YYZ4_MUSPF
STSQKAALAPRVGRVPGTSSPPAPGRERASPWPLRTPPIPLPALWDRLADTSPLGAFPLARVQERPGLSRFCSSSSAKTRLDSKVPFQPPLLERLL